MAAREARPGLAGRQSTGRGAGRAAAPATRATGRARALGAVRAAGLAAAAGALLAGALACAGCRGSDALTEVVYTQGASIVDTQSSSKYYSLSDDATASMPLDQATSQYSDTAQATQWVTLPVFGTPATTDQAIEQVLYDQATDSSRTAPVFPDDPTDLSDDADRQQDYSGGGNATPDEQQGSAEDDSGPEENDDASQGVSMHTDDPKVYNASGGLLAPLDNVRTIATVGEYADLALALGGPGTLVAGDSGFLGDEDVQRVFSDDQWQLDQVPQVWTYDEASDTYELDFDALMAADPDLVLVPDGVDLLTDDQQDQLLEAGISVEPAPAMDSTDSIEELARWLGDTLSDHTVSGRDASAMADDYIDTYLGDDVDAIVSENGGLTTYNDVDYSGGNGSAAPTTNWTLLVTDYDSRATYDAGLWSSTGVAIARAGYGWSPADYYLSVGGVNNNAAQFPVASMAGRKTYDYYVWQFNMSMLDPADVDGYIAVDAFGDTSYGLTQCLVGAPASIDREGSFETSLGADDFRYLLCANQSIADALAEARDADTASQTGLYAAYDYSEGAALQESGVGPRTSDGVLISAVIGSTTSGAESIGQQRADAGQNPYEVATVGSGLYCDWVDGSVESFLLAFWVDDFYDAAEEAQERDGSAVTVDDVDFSSLDAEATRFYEEFYGYELTEDDLAQIHEGQVD
ncbi:MAG: hypothetical protein SOI26_07565 [Coriobacteriales bacterium]|jgi:hypothetical protein